MASPKKRTPSPPPPSRIATLWRKLVSWQPDEQAKFWFAALCWFIAVFLCLSFVSYINYSWKSDNSYVQDATLWDILTDTDVEASNWFGRMGSFVAHLFFYRLFGFAAFIWVFFLASVGHKTIYENAPYSLSHRFGRCLFWSLVLPIFLSAVGNLYHTYYSSNPAFPWGGGIGHWVNYWANGFLGVGLWLFLLFFLAGLTFISGLYHYLKEQFAPFTKRITVPLPSAIARFLDWFSTLLFPNPSTTSNTNTNTNGSIGTNSNAHANNNNTANPADDANTDSNDGTLANTATGRQIKIDFSTNTANIGLPKSKATAADVADNFIINTPPPPPPLPADDTTILSTQNLTPNIDHDTNEDDDDLPDYEMSDLDADEHFRGKEYDPTLDLRDYRKPPVDILEKYGRDHHTQDKMDIDMEALKKNKDQIIQTLDNYGITISSITATPGPTVTLYEIVPAAGIRISRIKNLEDDIALSLAALGIRIIAPMPGKGTIGIEVPNQNKEIVSLRSMLASDKFQKANMELPIALGKTISDEDYVADLAKMPHLLLAGATGQGKSVCLNAILVSLLYKKHPAELKIVMIDPKKVELSLFAIIEKHFLAKLPDESEPIVTDTKKVINTLNALCIEMDLRYDLLKRAYVRNIREYNAKFKQRKLNPEKGHRYLPYILLLIDEFADLIMTAGKEVELPLARLAQLARAVGLHLVIATQRPTVNIITGTIKANFPVRVAFKVTSKIDSRTILDQGGANQLIGRGDMLLSIGGDIIRLQSPFVDTPEVERVAEYIGAQRGYSSAFLLPEYRDDSENTSDLNASNAFDLDDMFEDAARIIVQHQQGSTSLIQRRLKLGYNRSGRIMDQLEAMGVVGANQGSKAREVLIFDEYQLDHLFERIKQKRGY